MPFRRRPSRSRPRSSPARIILWLLLIVETIWLGAFIWSTRSFLPPGFSPTRPIEEMVTAPAGERRADAKLQEMLEKGASRGPGQEPPARRR